MRVMMIINEVDICAQSMKNVIFCQFLSFLISNISKGEVGFGQNEINLLIIISMQVIEIGDESLPLKQQSKSLEKSEKRKGDSSHRVDYRGITLREYFRLCEQTISYQPMQAIQQEDNPDTRGEQSDTPQFGAQQTRPRIRQVLKTDTNEENGISGHCKKSSLHNALDNRSYNRINISLGQANQLSCQKKAKKSHKSKRLVTFPSKTGCSSFNKTSSGSFYYLNDKKERMLQKVRVQKDRVQSMKLNEAMLVTKYASKFNINIKDMIK